MNTPKKTALPLGSWLYRNWQAQIAGNPEVFAEEIPFFSDARFTGELRTEPGPHLLLNTVPDTDIGDLAPSVVLRLQSHLDEGTDVIINAFRAGIPDVASFTGGTPVDEFAS